MGIRDLARIQGELLEMAHSCPDCGQACYCGGDVDDVLLVEGSSTCTHCDDMEDRDWEDYDEWEEDDEEDY